MSSTRRTFLQQLSGAAVAAAAAPHAFAAPTNPEQKPNIVYIMADELGYYELSCMGHPNIQTPNIDRLASEGVRFTQALAGASVCAPTRCCLMTGKHTGHTSVRRNDGGTPLREGEETVASVLKRVGYATGGFGKWGCGGRGSTGVPEKHGFDVFVGYYDQVHAHSYYPKYLIRNSEEVPLAENKGGRDGKTYTHYVIMNEGLKFIRQNAKRPFFAYFPITPPHGIFDIPDADPAWALYKDKDWPEDARRYAAMVTMVDRNVGEVVALLKELGVYENTIIFFCGDNGGNDYFRTKDRPRGFHGPNVNPKTGVAFRGHKGNLYEGGLRVPMIAHWAGRIKPNRVSDLLWYFPDVLPTAAELAGAPVPDDIDGISILPELLGEGVAGRKQQLHEYLYWEAGSQAAVRMGLWKAIRSKANAPWQLYDLSKDIEEKTDVAADHPGIVAKLAQYAEQAHEDAVPGTFQDRAIHEKDRQAKFGDSKKPSFKTKSMPQQGLIPSKAFKVVRASSESKFNSKLAKFAIDGDPRSIWHTAFKDGPGKHPHELVVDLGAEHSVRGFRYMARQDGGWNGAIKDCEFFVAGKPNGFGKPVAKATLKKAKDAQDVTFEPVKGRYVMLRALSEVNGGPWASVAELGVIGK